MDTDPEAYLLRVIACKVSLQVLILLLSLTVLVKCSIMCQAEADRQGLFLQVDQQDAFQTFLKEIKPTAFAPDLTLHGSPTVTQEQSGERVMCLRHVAGSMTQPYLSAIQLVNAQTCQAGWA